MAAEAHLGQSSVELRWRFGVIGASTGNVTRGPERRYPIVIGSSAPGAPSLFVSGNADVGPGGHLTVGARWATLRESPYFDDLARNDRTLLSVFTADWAPGWVPGLVLGASVTYRDPMEGSLSPSLFLRAFSTTSAQDEAQRGEDGTAALHGKWDAGPVTLWGTWGRGDYWLNIEDLITEPDHAQLYALGLGVRWRTASAAWAAVGEAASTVGPSVRAGSDYRHGIARAGHTHRGQMLGASIGPGARGAWLRLERTDSARTLGVELERILRDLDVYNINFSRRDGSSGEDREWRFGLFYEGPLPRFEVPGLKVSANGGLSFRWNRDYIRYSRNAHLVGPRESQIFLDLGFTWDPNVKRDSAPVGTQGPSLGRTR